MLVTTMLASVRNLLITLVKKPLGAQMLVTNVRFSSGISNRTLLDLYVIFSPRWVIINHQPSTSIVEHLRNNLHGSSSFWTHVCSTIPLGAGCHGNLSNPPISIAFGTPFFDAPRLQGIFPATGFDSRALACGFEQISHTTKSRQAVASSIQALKEARRKLWRWWWRLGCYYYRLLDTKFNKSCLSVVVVAFYCCLHAFYLVSYISKIPCLVCGDFRPDPTNPDKIWRKIG